MSPEVKKRVRALKNLILAQSEIKSRFKAEVHLLKLKYQKVYEPYINKQVDIIQGKYEPTKGEYSSSSSEEEDVPVPRYDEQGEIRPESSKQEPKGIPDFWLVYMETSYKFRSVILPHDEQIFRHLSDIRCNWSEEYMGFTMEFHFTPNEWFTNNVLTLKFEENPPDDVVEIVLSYGIEDAIEYRLTGCEIHWNAGKNVTQKIMDVKFEGTEVPINKSVEYPSFFNLFNDHFNLTNPDGEYFQHFFKQYKKQCNWIVLEAFMSYCSYLFQAVTFAISEMSDFSEDSKTNELHIGTIGEDDKCMSNSPMK
ncbi:nucleosome assembly protein 1-like 1 [Myzus persicae]|uniref:nucleosome assembly protein 1-like 1 n=1 Tax=Myzus persicae TaxID=13164 RepID=UPI000B936A4F|nr:nucleosome assembly protein 1-like 1 [Myzus persicae]